MARAHKRHGYVRLPPGGLDDDPLEALRVYADDTSALAYELQALAIASVGPRVSRASWPSFGRKLERALERNHIVPTPGGSVAQLIDRLKYGAF